MHKHDAFRVCLSVLTCALQVHHATSKLASAPQSPEDFADLLDFMEQLEQRRHGLDDTYDHVCPPPVLPLTFPSFSLQIRLRIRLFLHTVHSLFSLLTMVLSFACAGDPPASVCPPGTPGVVQIQAAA